MKNCFVDDPKLESYFESILPKVRSQLALWYQDTLSVKADPFASAVLDAPTAAGDVPVTSSIIQSNTPVASRRKKR
jgi:hypothetical protein